MNSNITHENSNRIRSTANFLANKMPSVNKKNQNPIDSLSIEDINYLQKYLELIKNKKIASMSKINTPSTNNSEGIFLDNTTKNRTNDIYDPLSREVPVDWRTYKQPSISQFYQSDFEPGARGAANTRQGKRSQQINNDMTNNTVYHNPYEYGAKQNILPSKYKQIYNGPYSVDPLVLNYMGVQNSDQQPDHIRNINIESSLLQKEMTHGPGQRIVTEKEMNRFELLPFDPQDHHHIVWSDNMPRGGFSTRSERLELN